MFLVAGGFIILSTLLRKVTPVRKSSPWQNRYKKGLGNASDSKSETRARALEAMKWTGNLDDHQIELIDGNLELRPPDTYTINLKTTISRGRFRQAPSIIHALFGRNLIQEMPPLIEVYIYEKGFRIDQDSLADINSDSLKLLVELSKKLAAVQDVVQTLLSNLKDETKYDPVACLDALRAFPLSSENLARIKPYLNNDAPEIRLEASLLLGEEGQNHLIELADPAEPAELAIEAINNLNTKNLEPPARTALYALPQKSPGQYTASQYAIWAGNLCQKLPDPESDEEAASLLQLCRNFEKAQIPMQETVAIPLFRLFAQYFYKPVQTWLVEYLDSSPSKTCFIAAVRALEPGDKDAIEDLYRHANYGNPTAEVKIALQTTIKAIQSRLGDVDHGWLSLHNHDESGKLSISDNRAGNLQIVDEDTKPNGTNA